MTTPRFTRKGEASHDSWSPYRATNAEFGRSCARDIRLRLLRQLIDPWPQNVVECELTSRILRAVWEQDRWTAHWAIERLRRDGGGSAEVDGLRALSEAACGRLGEAVVQARRASRSELAVPAYRGLFGWLLTETGNGSAAAHTFRAMSALDPPAVAPRVGLAAAMGRQGAHDEAVELLERLAGAAGRAGPLIADHAGPLIADHAALLLLESVEQAPPSRTPAGAVETADLERRLRRAARIVEHPVLARCIARLRSQVADRQGIGSAPVQAWPHRCEGRGPAAGRGWAQA